MTNKYNVVVWGFMLHASNESPLALQYQPIVAMSPYAPRTVEMVQLGCGEKKSRTGSCSLYLAAWLLTFYGPLEACIIFLAANPVVRQSHGLDIRHNTTTCSRLRFWSASSGDLAQVL